MDQARRNFWIGVLHEGAWGLGTGFIVPATILALALVDLGRSASSAGLLAGIFVVGLNLPQVFSASFFSGFVTTPKHVAWLHAPIVAGPLLAALGFAFLPPGPGHAKLLFLFVGFGLQSLGLGLMIPHWIVLMGRCIPERIRGRYFGTSFFASGLLAIPAGWWAARCAARGGLSWGYTLCFALSVPFMILSAVLLTRLQPLTPPIVPAREPLFKVGRSMLERFWVSKPLRVGLLLTILLVFLNAPTALYTVFLRQRIGLGANWFEAFAPAMAAGSMMGALLLGFLVDHRGVQAALATTFGVGLLGLGVIAFWPQPPMPMLAFACAGFTGAAGTSVIMVLNLSLAEGENRTRQVGMFNTLMAPWNFFAPWVAGVLASGHGYGYVFLAAGLSALAAIVLMGVHGGQLASPDERKRI